MQTEFHDASMVHVSAINESKPLVINTNIGTLQSHSNSTHLITPLRPDSNSKTMLHLAVAGNAPRFNQQLQFAQITTASSEPVQVYLGARIEGGFFQHDGLWTCYRRNYIRVMCTMNFLLKADPASGSPAQRLLNDEAIYYGSQTIQGYRVILRASSNVGHNKLVDLVVHTAKRDRIPNAPPTPRWISPGGDPADPAPPKTPLTPLPPGAVSPARSTSSSSSNDEFDVTQAIHQLACTSDVPPQRPPTMIAYDRVQFRTATANNGKRKSIQEYYRLSFELYGVMASGPDDTRLAMNGNLQEVLLARVDSEDIVVRGRSPGHYADLEKIKERRTLDTAVLPGRRRGSFKSPRRPIGSRNGDASPMHDRHPMEVEFAQSAVSVLMNPVPGMLSSHDIRQVMSANASIADFSSTDWMWPNTSLGSAESVGPVFHESWNDNLLPPPDPNLVGARRRAHTMDPGSIRPSFSDPEREPWRRDERLVADTLNRQLSEPITSNQSMSHGLSSMPQPILPMKKSEHDAPLPVAVSSLQGNEPMLPDLDSMDHMLGSSELFSEHDMMDTTMDSNGSQSSVIYHLNMTNVAGLDPIQSDLNSESNNSVGLDRGHPGAIRNPMQSGFPSYASQSNNENITSLSPDSCVDQQPALDVWLMSGLLFQQSKDVEQSLFRSRNHGPALKVQTEPTRNLSSYWQSYKSPSTLSPSSIPRPPCNTPITPSPQTQTFSTNKFL